MGRKRRIKKRRVKGINGKPDYTIYSISVPERLALQVPEEMYLVAELTEDGLIFRPVLPEKVIPAPTWCKKDVEIPEYEAGGPD